MSNFDKAAHAAVQRVIAPAEHQQPGAYDGEIVFTIFPDTSASSKTQQRARWVDVAKLVQHPREYANKAACPLIKLAAFGDARSKNDSLRHDANMRLVYGIEGDYDAERVSPSQAAEMLRAAGIEALIYTTARHTAAAPRWRVLAPLAEPCETPQRHRFVGVLNAVLGGILAEESFTASQSYYFGKVRGVAYEEHRVHGRPIDDTPSLFWEPVYGRGKAPAVPRHHADAYPTPDDLTRVPELARVSQDTIDDLRSALIFLAEKGHGDHYREWHDAGQAIKSLSATPFAEDAFDLWVAYSEQCAGFDADEAHRKWERDLKGDRTLYPAIFKSAAASGWVNPRKGIKPTADPSSARRFEVVQAGAFAAGKAPDWIVANVLPEAQLVVIYGESGSGKSFFVVDLVVCVALGIAWRGLRVRPGRVIYIAAEGAGGFRKRLTAIARHHSLDLSTLPLGVIGDDAPNLLLDDDIAIAASIGEAGGASVIVIDTLASVTPGANENAAEDMGKMIGHCKRLHAATGALVVLVHHSGKDAARGARGWSGIRAAADAEIEITRNGDARAARITKQKDGEDSATFAFRLQPVAVGVDEDGAEITSCVVQHLGAAPPKRAEPRGPTERLLYRITQGFGEATVDVLLGAAVEQMTHDPQKRDRRREHATRAVASLIESAFLCKSGDIISVPHASRLPHEAHGADGANPFAMPHEPHHPIGVGREARDAAAN